MKRPANLLSAVALAIVVSFSGLTALAHNARGSGAVFSLGGRAGGYRGGYSGRFLNGFRSGYFARNYHQYGRFGRWYRSDFSFAYVYSLPPSYDYCDYPPPPVYDTPTVVYSSPTVYSSPPAVIYASPLPAPEAQNSQLVAVDHSVPAVAADHDIPQAASMRQQQFTTQYSPQSQSLGVAEVKALAKVGLSDKVIIDQIRNSHVVYHLTAVEIIDMKESGVSPKVIDFMISTSSGASSPSDQPFKLTGIMNLPDGDLLAVINGKVVVEKNYVDGATVKKIDRDQVTLDLNGHDFVVRL
ncbi:MAG TPA: hypothetical protein VL171_04930 [Verrucomicrobiae bacterium]|nr:hypothetical protein [Verrucomicrobiae bacterium]